ncbi:Glycosyltransferase, catalytic subunit of cellulose synthase and poly-beta-1,6-N-acetylglucosamine synthase [Acetitomaculum ruminis DSM 5522]|uniref:Glycosyltransferase, catalytic subunit of cellulose synthase and poly-beta-1,6-N-acetylglucosamine synthase n=1 Tax=Acetitomaculum ruminis DSM 5522 TaxID=1120918 RepID=A0A1I0WKW8_9FIRM|nr:glycosyltransferase family 2 protein [Acetitomaculum ruminis]SFA89392.1 Glycosyltransferase, catalytic subunit of cellulose synthase and poly-beta-1,6-N-acetylglucosamine synthase [Acetitomaculum ruminis DSM 5522]
MQKFELFVDVVWTILEIAPMLVMGWLAFILVFGLIKRKALVKAFSDYKNRFAIIVCAHNEEKAIGSLLSSLGDLDYDKDKYHVYVICDHCTDKTAEIAGSYPFVTVMERNEGPTTGKGVVLSWGLPRILKMTEKDSCDAFVFFDADNVAKADFLTEMSKKMNQGNDIIQGNRLGGRPYNTYVTKWYTLYWASYTTYFSYAREKLNLSAFLTGTGFVVKRDLIEKEGWDTSTITEDVEYSIQNCIKGRRVAFCISAICFDEQPSELKVMMNQLSRWTTGSYQILNKYFYSIIRSKNERFLQKLDSLMFLLMGPCSWLSAIITALNMLIILWKLPLYACLPAVILGVVGLMTMYIAVYGAARYNKIESEGMFFALLTFPLFTFAYMICSIKTCFKPSTTWVKIEHKSLDRAQV